MISWICLFILFAGTLLMTVLAGHFILPLLIRMKFGQPINEYVEEHKNKAGTPTCGGLFFIVATVISSVGVSIYLAVSGNASVGRMWSVLCLGLANAAIGFLDDWCKKRKAQNEGLKAWQKLVLQIAVAAVFVTVMALTGLMTTSFNVFGHPVDLKFFYYILAVIGIVGFVNATNLTDGLDGLAASNGALVALALSCASVMCLCIDCSYLGVILAGAFGGFLFWNINPAKVFMGDTGSLFIGGTLIGISLLIGEPLLAIICGIYYIWEMLSVIIQVGFFKITKKIYHTKEGKRVFLRAPFHHHLQLKGWNENKVVFVSCSITFILSVLSLILLN